MFPKTREILNVLKVTANTVVMLETYKALSELSMAEAELEVKNRRIGELEKENKELQESLDAIR